MPSIRKMTVIGVGLIGGSLAQALREAAFCEEIVGVGRDPGRLDKAVGLGVIDRYETDLVRGVRGADLIVVCVPLGAIGAVFRGIAGHLEATAVITDVGSAKGSVASDARSYLPGSLARFVPGHPIAGTERSGVEASFAQLFSNRRVILTPLPETDDEARDLVRRAWEAAGATVTEMSVAHHDEVLAATSHLPHMLAFSLVDTLSRWSDRTEIFQYAAGGFRDFTRIASSDPVMWRDVCLANREALLAAMDRFMKDLDGVREAIREGDSVRLEAVFRHAKQARDAFSAIEGSGKK